MGLISGLFDYCLLTTIKFAKFEGTTKFDSIMSDLKRAWRLPLALLWHELDP